MRRVLIISPHFPPTNAPDMQRVRMVALHLREAGVDAEVLAVEAAQVAAPRDPWLAAGLPPELAIHRVKALGLAWTRLPGLGTLSFRALRAMAAKGDELLRGGNFDLIYFSTTQFGIHALGPRWKKKYGVPFVMDYQDPWVNDYYRDHPDIVPPGGRFKYGLADGMNRRSEPKVLRDCLGITSVSTGYPAQLARRYDWLDVVDTAPENPARESPALSTGRHSLFSAVMPFPGDEHDLERVRRSALRQTVFDPRDGLRHWIYIGRGGRDMERAVRAIFHSLAVRSRSAKAYADLRLHFVGTSYAAAGRGVKTIEPLAVEYGLENVVREHPDRIPYSETLRCLLDADALVVPGSDDPAYTASKIYPYLLAEKPMLAVFHEDSSVVELMRRAGGGKVVAFRNDEAPEAIGERILAEALPAEGGLVPTPLDRLAFRPHTAKAQASELKRFFDICLAANGTSSHNNGHG